MADIEAVSASTTQFMTISELVASSPQLQVALTALIVGLVALGLAYRKFSSWTRSQEFSYTRPHLSRFVRVAILPIFAIALVTSVNAYAHASALFDGAESGDGSPSGMFAMMLNTINILVVGYTAATLVPIVITRQQKSTEEADDYAQWREMGGFPDDAGDTFHELFRWIPPKTAPEEIGASTFEEKLGTPEGVAWLEAYRTEKGAPIGSYEQKRDDAFAIWKAKEHAKYAAYLSLCLDGRNEACKKLRLGQSEEEVYPIDTWREVRRDSGYEAVIPGASPPGNAQKKRKGIPKSASAVLRIAILAAVALGVASWWGVDLWVLATAVGGMGIGIGLALQETMQNWFTYITIRKDKIMSEGDRIKLEGGYEGYIHQITPRVTYIRHALYESIAIIPTRQLINTQVINYSRESVIVPAVVNVGVSYLNDPRQVSSILVKVGRRAMAECVDARLRHIVRQRKCPYVLQNKQSCGCDRDIHITLDQPTVRLNSFDDSAINFSMWVYVRDYGSQFKVQTDMRIFMYEEFKKYNINIPWPIRTIYQGDAKREEAEIAKLDQDRNAIVDEYGTGDLVRGGDEY